MERRSLLLISAIAAASIGLGGITFVSGTFQSPLSGEKITAVEAHDLVKRQQLILIDIRTPGEWRQSGIAEGAIPISMRDPDFFSNVLKLQNENPAKRIAIICATGGRTQALQNNYNKRGLLPLIDVAEGMFGNGQHPGWIARKLPLRKWSGQNKQS